MTAGFVTTGDGCRLAYRLDGPKGAPVLLLSNSLGTTMDMWAAQLPILAERFRVLRYDSRCHGQSQVPAGSYSMDRLGRDVIELLDALAVPAVSFCGVSQGGMVGQWLGIRAPDRLSRLVIANSSPFMGPPSDWDARVALVLARGTGAIADAVVERWFTAAFRADPANVAAILAAFRAIDATGYAGCCAAIRDMDNRRLLRLISTPTLVIGGSDDPATPPPHSELLAASIAGATLVMLPAAHLSNVEQPALFNAALLDHLGH